MTLTFPSFEPVPQSPKVAEDFVGVALAVPPAELQETTALPLFGVFQLDDKTVGQLPGADPFRAVVVLLIEEDGYHPYCLHPAGQSILLEAAKAPRGIFRGYFNVEAFRMAHIPPRPGRFFVSAYLAQYCSASIAVEVTGEAHHHDHRDIGV